MSSYASLVKKSQIVITASVLLFFIAITSMVLVFTEYSNTIVDNAAEEAEHDLNFLSSLVKKSYLKRDFVGIEQLLAEWISDNKLDFSIRTVAANGYEFFSYERPEAIRHSKKVDTRIYDEDKLLFTITLERDISAVVKQAQDTTRSFILIGLGIGALLGITIWLFLHRFAFKPLNKEISYRLKAEIDLKKANDDLEKRVQERTEDIKRLSRVVEQTDDVVIITDNQGIVVYVNPSFVKHTGYTSEEAVGKNLGFIQSGLHNKEFYDNLWKTISAGNSFRDIFINRKKNQDTYYEEKTITPIKNEEGEIQYFVSTGKDISDRIESQERLHYLATHDALTDLPNKLTIVDRLSHAIKQGARTNRQIAVLFLDLDHFKHINDSFGHSIGDMLLQQVSSRLSEAVRKGDTVGRFGGDEFVIIMEDLKSIDDIAIVCKKILEAIAQPIMIKKYEILTHTSIGVSVFPDDADNSDSLLTNADIAMYRAKSRGGNIYQLYTPDMGSSSIERLKLQHKLKTALANNEFTLHYQPQINIMSGQVIGMEALLRWNNSEIGFVGPDKFVPILEEMGLIIEIGMWVTRSACEFNALLVDKGHRPIKVSVNLSTKQFNDDELIPSIEQIIEDCKLDPQFLEFEITESILIDNTARAATILNDLHRIGVYVSIDDFGTGFSSLSYLKNYPIDSLKIDRSFVQDIPNEKEDVAIVNAILALGKNLGINITAEGIETSEQLEFFKNGPCRIAQGFLISKPLPQDEFELFLTKANEENNVEQEV